MTIEEIKEKMKNPLKGLMGVQFCAENFTTLTFRKNDIAFIKLSALTPIYPDFFDFPIAPEFSKYFKATYAKIILRPSADNMNRFDVQPDTLVATRQNPSLSNPNHWRYLTVFERLMESPNIVSWDLLYDKNYWNTGTEHRLIVYLPYINKFERTNEWHEHNILQTSYLDKKGYLNIIVKKK